MPGDGAVAVTERLESGNLAALGGDLAAQHHVQDEHGHRQKDGRQHRAHDLERCQLVFDNLGRHQLVAPGGTNCAIGFKQMVNAINHLLSGGTCIEPQRHLVERTLHVKGVKHAGGIDPPDAKRLVIRCAAL